MQFEFTDPQTEFERAIGGSFSINALGTIRAGDGIKFREFVDRSAPPPRTTVYIDSSGGNVEEAMIIGRIIRDCWFSTSIGKCLLNTNEISDISHLLVPRVRLSGRCMSAATLVFLGGRLRYFPQGSEFGVHQFSFKNPSPGDVGQSQVLSAKIARFLVDMGVSPDFLEFSSSVRNDSILIADEDNLKTLGVVTGGETDTIWTVQAQADMIYVRGERDSLHGHHKVMLGHTKGAGFFFWAVIEAQGREDELTSLGLVEIVLNGEEKRIDISTRCERIVSGIYVNVFAKVTQEEARAIAYSTSFGVHIRFWLDSPMFLGIAPVPTAGGTEQLQTIYNVFFKDEETLPKSL
ncbi:hypothetical protein AB6802_04135 [Mesorhizobium sp. RCC_202]|uniref:COG3904 family protein n=1 Tax=Mesorhizobium sp. RCC_202 TaxID=3239222 RepID=UPI003526B4A4